VEQGERAGDQRPGLDPTVERVMQKPRANDREQEDVGDPEQAGALPGLGEQDDGL
jgi:hypothetical protein